jgi:hypothetical protein
MKLKSCAAIVLAVAVLSVPALTAQAKTFDGKRKGFIVGGGIGGSYLSYSEGGQFDLPEFSLAANFKIGYATSESFEIYYIFSGSAIFGVIANYALGVSGVGVTKYLNREGKGIFLFGGVGFPVFVFGGMFGWTKSTNGFGLIGGIGSDIGRHWSIQGDVVYTDMNAEMVTSVSFRVTINFLAF